MPICYFYMLNYVYAILYSVDIHLVCALDWAIKTELFPSFSCLILKTYNSLVFLLSSSLLFPDLGNFYFSFPDVWDLLDLVWCVEIASCTSDLSNKVNSNIYICTWIRQSNPLLFVFKLLPGGLWKHYLTLWRLVTGWLKLILRSKAVRFLLCFIVSYHYEKTKRG
jgi:hypothetical protein